MNAAEPRTSDARSTRVAPTSAATSGDWLVWQLVDSAFPTGGFAHSAGLEAASQHGEVRHGSELRSWIELSLSQLAHAALPFVNAAHAEPQRLIDLDQLCDAFTPNHVANRASRIQGMALLAAVKRIFPASSREATPALATPPFAHLAPVFGACIRSLGICHLVAVRLFIFLHLRGVMAAAVRLNIVGPMEGQALQQQLGARAEELVQRALSLTLDDLAQTAPLLDLWQAAQDRLYSRLFQT